MRFNTSASKAWALVPGPRELHHSLSSDSVREVAEYAAAEIEQQARAFPGLRVTEAAVPDHEYWEAEIRTAQGWLMLQMKLQDEITFGGFGLTGDCERELLLGFWSHLQAKFVAVWLFAPDLRIYTQSAALEGPLA